MSCTKAISSTDPFSERVPFHTVPALFTFQPLIAVRFVPCYNKADCRRMAAKTENSGKEGNTMAVIGIDLGTTNSLACVYRDGKAELIENELGSPMTPSCVSVLEDGTVLVGAAAKERLISHPDRTAASFKTWMGTEKTYSLGGRSFLPHELSALVLKKLADDARRFLGEEIEEAIISVPAYFNDNQRCATKLAAELAGLPVKRLINEPSAAALCYSEPEVNEKLACDQIQDFCEGKLNRLEFEWPKEGYSLVLMRDKDQYACFIFDDVKQMTCTYLSNPKAYQTVDSELVQYVPFFLGKLPFYAVHENMENICAILPGILSKLSQPAPKEQRLKMLSIFTWSQKVYLYSSAQRYWFDRRTVGDFPPGRGTLSLTGKFQIEKQPDLLLLEEKDGALREEPVSAQNRSAVYTNLVGFFLGRVRRFGMAWNLPEGEVRLRLECEGDGDEKRYALSVTREGRTEYLAIEKELGWSAKERMRWELTRIRDFMDLFLMSLPDVKRLLSMLEKLGTLR